AVIDVDPRDSERRGHARVPVVVDVRGPAGDRKRLAGHRRAPVGQIERGPDVDRRVFEVVLYSGAVRELEPQDVLARELDVRAEARSPSGDVTPEIERVHRPLDPTDVAQHTGESHVSPFAAVLVSGGEIWSRIMRF